jgi:hypothetical protein
MKQAMLILVLGVISFSFAQDSLKTAIQTESGPETILSNPTLQEKKKSSPEIARSSTPVHYAKAIGAGAGFVTGYGIAYRKWFSEKSGLQITGIPFYYEDNYSNGDNYLYSSSDSGFTHTGNLCLGAIYLRTLAEKDELKVLTYYGGNFSLDYEKTERWSKINGTSSLLESSTRLEKKLTIGFGIGGDLQMWRLIGNLMIGLRGFYEFEYQGKGIYPTIEFTGLFGY